MPEPTDPSPAEIAQRAARIRAGWSKTEKRYRRHCPHLDRSRADVLDELRVGVQVAKGPGENEG